VSGDGDDWATPVPPSLPPDDGRTCVACLRSLAPLPRRTFLAVSSCLAVTTMVVASGSTLAGTDATVVADPARGLPFDDGTWFDDGTGWVD